MMRARSPLTCALVGTALLVLTACSDSTQDVARAANAQDEVQAAVARVATITVQPRRVVV